MIQRYEEEAEAFYQATGVMAPGKDAAAAMHGYDADELRHKLWRMWARAVYAERERDEVRQRAERAERAERIAAALRADRESLSSQLQNCTYDRDGWKRRAERFERILAALRKPSESIMHTAYLASFQHALFERAWTATLCAAVTAAEQEVGRE